MQSKWLYEKHTDMGSYNGDGAGARGGHKSAVPDATEVREGQTEALTGYLNPPLLFSTLGCVSLYHPLKPDLGFPLWFPCLFLVTLVPPKVISQGSGHLPLTFFNLELGPWGSMQWWPFIVSSIQPRMIYQCEVVQISLACGHVHGGLFFFKKKLLHWLIWEGPAHSGQYYFLCWALGWMKSRRWTSTGKHASVSLSNFLNKWYD